MSHAIGAVSAGHSETAKSAAKVLKEGGNAFDAIVAAHLTACVAEPVLASFGGGGFLLAETKEGKQVLYDFFVQTPITIKNKSELNFFPISADFGATQQEFHIGEGAIATPGTVKGFFEIHKDLCSLPFSQLAEHAIILARKGLIMNSFQAGVLDVVSPIYLSSIEAKRNYRSSYAEHDLIQEGEVLKQPMLANFIERLVQEGESFFYDGKVTEMICNRCKENGGQLTKKDFNRYKVIKREPIQILYKNASIAINPPPSSGGLLTAFALKLLETARKEFFEFGTADYLDFLAQIQGLTNKARIESIIESDDYSASERILHDSYVEIYKNQIMDRFHSSRGTTQISVMDKFGNTASLTTSNGSGSGVMIPEMGVMLNNMLGEKDLNPGGFYNWVSDQRISSMMAPVIANLKDGTKVAYGSGGSNRIRTAILQVLINLIDMEMSLKEAVKAPRIHYEEELLNIEPGFPPNDIKVLCEKYPDHKIWEDQNLFFGGTHAVSRSQKNYLGFGDPRRGGVSIIVEE